MAKKGEKTNMNIKSYLLISFLLTSGSMAWGQAVVTPINNWNYQRHASTAAEGFLNGQARVIQAVGQSNYLNSVAAVNLQEAQSKWIDNRKKYVTTYYENKVYSQEMRDRYAKRPPTKEVWDKITANSLPDPLTTQQYDRAAGRITWPHILRTNEYDAFRNRIDELMAQRTADNDGDGSPFQREIASLVDAMKMLLKTNINTVTDSQYADAKSFLRSLDYEVKVVRSAPGSAAPTVVDPLSTASTK
jgi:hypothetical protein